MTTKAIVSSVAVTHSSRDGHVTRFISETTPVTNICARAALAARLCAGALLAGRDSEGTKGLQRTAALVAPLALLGVSAVVVVQAGTWHWLV